MVNTIAASKMGLEKQTENTQAGLKDQKSNHAADDLTSKTLPQLPP